MLGPTIIGNIPGRSAAVDAAKKAVEAQSNFIKNIGGEIFDHLDPRRQLLLDLKHGGKSGAINHLI